jgi:signal peptidase I
LAIEQTRGTKASIGGWHMEQVKENQVENKKKQNIDNKKNSMKEWIILVLIFAFLVFIIPNYIMQRTYVDGQSMENTLHGGEYVLREKVTNYFSNPERFDIIVFYSDVLEKDCIKRVIGLPGEKVQIIGTDIYINDEKLEESFGKDPISDPGIANDPITLGEDEYFVLGDNREESLDSRAEGIGPVKKEDMDGRALLRIWPLSKLGTVN